jgi:hypothetical protein
MRGPDAVLQEVWRVKDTAFAQAGYDAQRFVQQLQARSAQLRQGLALKPLEVAPKAPQSTGATNLTKPV